MMAAIYDNLLRRVSLKTIKLPQIDRDEQLIRVKACGICGSDLHLFRKPSPQKLAKNLFRALKGSSKIILGHEITGDTVQGFTSRGNNRVVVYPRILCGQCENCRKGMENLCINSHNIGKELPGGFAEYVIVPSRNVVELPPHLTYEEGTLIEPLGVAYHAITMLGVEYQEY